MSNYRGSMLNKGPCETMAGVDGSIDRSIQFRLNIFHWWRVINARGQRDKISRLRTRKLAPENSHREFPRNNFPLPLFKATVSREERNYRPSVRISISTRVLVFAQSSVLDAPLDGLIRITRAMLIERNPISWNRYARIGIRPSRLFHPRTRL